MILLAKNKRFIERQMIFSFLLTDLQPFRSGRFHILSILYYKFPQSMTTSSIPLKRRKKNKPFKGQKGRIRKQRKISAETFRRMSCRYYSIIFADHLELKNGLADRKIKMRKEKMKIRYTSRDNYSTCKPYS